MNVFIAEDEAPARERLVESIARVAPHARIAGMAGSVVDASAWLSSHPAPDLLLLDVQLSDGLSFELFARGEVHSPAVFATAYDEFVLEAFRANAIDYLLKPVSDAALRQAFASYRRLKSHFSADVARVITELALPPGSSRQRQRIVARKGSAYVTLRFDQIAWFVSVDKLTYAVDLQGERHLVDATLAELDADLDPMEFFRVSRQVIVSGAAVIGFKPAGRGKLALQLRPDSRETITVPQERAAAFRKWVGS